MNKIKNIFSFGEKIDGFDVRVLNEREVRASAGILFFFAIVSFMNALLSGNFYMTKIFIVVFLIDFFIRVFVNPKYSPSLILGRFFVKNQKPEYVGATQKRFAWGLGFVLAFIMFITIVVIGIFSPLNGLICMLCLLLLFFESAFGICLGCKIYNIFNKEKAKLCPGGTCEVVINEEIQKINMNQILILILFFVAIGFLISSPLIERGDDLRKNMDNNKIFVVEGVGVEKNKDDCVVPQWAKDIGHEEIYKNHKCN